MPLVCVWFGTPKEGTSSWFIFEYAEGVNYNKFTCFAEALVHRECSQPTIDKTEVRALLNWLSLTGSMNLSVTRFSKLQHSLLLWQENQLDLKKGLIDRELLNQCSKKLAVWEKLLRTLLFYKMNIFYSHMVFVCRTLLQILNLKVTVCVMTQTLWNPHQLLLLMFARIWMTRYQVVSFQRQRCWHPVWWHGRFSEVSALEDLPLVDIGIYTFWLELLQYCGYGWIKSVYWTK